MQSSSSPLVSRIDHIMIRVSDAIYDQVFSLFADTLQLPIAWDVHNYYPPFKAGGIVAGSINMEIFRSGERPLYPSQAQLYGIALETPPLSESLQELTRRDIPHLPPYAIPQAYLSNPGEFYTLVYIGELLGGCLSQFFAADQIGLGAIDSLIFDQVFGHGTVFLCEYNPAFWNISQERQSKMTLLREKHGGSLGLEDVQTLIIGVADEEKALMQWQRLLAPLMPVRKGEWQFKEGPAIRLVPHERDEILAMTWKVASLEQASAFLQAKGMLGKVTANQITLERAATHGLEIHLIE
jgi:hypothetical protein